MHLPLTIREATQLRDVIATDPKLTEIHRRLGSYIERYPSSIMVLFRHISGKREISTRWGMRNDGVTAVEVLEEDLLNNLQYGKRDETEKLFERKESRLYIETLEEKIEAILSQQQGALWGRASKLIADLKEELRNHYGIK